MPDPFDVLGSPVVPVAPDPDFAARLRRRVADAISPTNLQEETMSDVLARNGVSRNGARPGDVSYISLGLPDDARGRAFYGSVLGWTFAPGQVEHAGNQVDEVIPQVGLWAGPQRGGEAVHGAVLAFRVDDLSAAVARVREAGGTATDPAGRPYGLEADCTDGQGLGFYLHQLPSSGRPAPSGGERNGDISYVVLLVADVDHARAFFGTVLGWGASPGSGGGIQITGTTPMIGMAGAGGSRPGAVLCYLVDDIATAVARVRQAGGTAPDPEQRPYGAEAHCADDQGTAFYLHQFPG